MNIDREGCTRILTNTKGRMAVVCPRVDSVSVAWQLIKQKVWSCVIGGCNFDPAQPVWPTKKGRRKSLRPGQQVSNNSTRMMRFELAASKAGPMEGHFYIKFSFRKVVRLAVSGLPFKRHESTSGARNSNASHPELALDGALQARTGTGCAAIQGKSESFLYRMRELAVSHTFLCRMCLRSMPRNERKCDLLPRRTDSDGDQRINRRHLMSSFFAIGKRGEGLGVTYFL